MSLKKRIATILQQDAKYSWNQYIGDFKETKKTSQGDIEELSKITVFGQLTNEDSMYYEAKKIAQRAENIQKKGFKFESKKLLSLPQKHSI